MDDEVRSLIPKSSQHNHYEANTLIRLEGYNICKINFNDPNHFR